MIMCNKLSLHGKKHTTEEFTSKSKMTEVYKGKIFTTYKCTKYQECIKHPVLPIGINSYHSFIAWLYATIYSNCLICVFSLHDSTNPMKVLSPLYNLKRHRGICGTPLHTQIVVTKLPCELQSVSSMERQILKNWKD